MNKELEIKPHIGIGILRLGDNIDKIIRQLGKPNSIREHTYTSGTSYYFDKNSIMVDIDSENNAEAVQVSAPYNVKLGDFSFIGKPFCIVRIWLEDHDKEMEFDGASLISNNLGVGVFAQSAGKAPEEPVESVIVFKKDYYC